MSTTSPRWERSRAPIEEVIRVVRRESAAALSTAEAFLQDAGRHPRLDLPHRFPVPDGPDRAPRDKPGEPRGRGDAAPAGR